MSNTQNKLNLYEPKSRLAFSDRLSDELLSEFTPSDLITYEKEHKVMMEQQAKDTVMVQDTIEQVRKGLEFLFGDCSRQTKYIDRSLTKGETVMDTHYARFANPKTVEQRVDSAKLKVGTAGVSAGLNETNVDALNEAIEFLTKNGYVFGRDFNAHNAVDMAKLGYLELCRVDTKNIKISKSTKPCEECDSEVTMDNVNVNQLLVSCRCYDDRTLDIIFEDAAPVFATMEGEIRD